MMRGSLVVTSLTAGALGALLLSGLSIAATARDVPGAACVPADANWSSIRYANNGAIRNHSTTTRQKVICPHPDGGGGRTNYKANLTFEPGSQFNGGTDCALRVTSSSQHGAPIVASASGAWFGGNSLLRLSVTVPSATLSTSANLRCELPISASNGVPGISAINLQSSP